MPGKVPEYEWGPLTYEAGVAIAGGQLVIPYASDTTKVGPAGDGAINVLGVATKDAVPVGTNQNQAASGVLPGSFNLSPISQYIAVACYGHFRLLNTTNIARGKAVVAAAAGKVRAYVSGTDTPDMIIGKSTDHVDKLANDTKGVLIKLNI